jgi:1-deoxy-D-xylulose-5-phosphate reductoisomerase
MKRVSILGSTGSIGEQTLSVIDKFPERYRAVALAAGRNVARLAEQVERFRPELVSVAEASAARELADRLAGRACPEIAVGAAGLDEVAGAPADLVVAGLVGAVGIEPTLAAIRAIFQALAGQRERDVARLILTASGGPFRTWPAERIAEASVEEALNHPNWKMGPKITIDSATLMNKGLEVIEARWLFDVPAARIDVVVHPESSVHSLVEFVDGSVLAQLGLPDMRVPIAVALAHPERLPLDLPRLELAEMGALHFEAPDRARFPALGLAFAALEAGEAAPAVLNAANEESVGAFLRGEIRVPEIAAHNEAALDAWRRAGGGALRDLADVAEADRFGRHCVRERLGLSASQEVRA